MPGGQEGARGARRCHIGGFPSGHRNEADRRTRVVYAESDATVGERRGREHVAAAPHQPFGRGSVQRHAPSGEERVVNPGCRQIERSACAGPLHAAIPPEPEAGGERARLARLDLRHGQGRASVCGVKVRDRAPIGRSHRRGPSPGAVDEQARAAGSRRIRDPRGIGTRVLKRGHGPVAQQSRIVDACVPGIHDARLLAGGRVQGPDPVTIGPAVDVHDARAVGRPGDPRPSRRRLRRREDGPGRHVVDRQRSAVRGVVGEHDPVAGGRRYAGIGVVEVRVHVSGEHDVHSLLDMDSARRRREERCCGKAAQQPPTEGKVHPILRPVMRWRSGGPLPPPAHPPPDSGNQQAQSRAVKSRHALPPPPPEVAPERYTSQSQARIRGEMRSPVISPTSRIAPSRRRIHNVTKTQSLCRLGSAAHVGLSWRDDLTFDWRPYHPVR